MREQLPKWSAMPAQIGLASILYSYALSQGRWKNDFQPRSWRQCTQLARTTGLTVGETISTLVASKKETGPSVISTSNGAMPDKATPAWRAIWRYGCARRDRWMLEQFEAVGLGARMLIGP